MPARLDSPLEARVDGEGGELATLSLSLSHSHTNAAMSGERVQSRADCGWTRH